MNIAANLKNQIRLDFKNKRKTLDKAKVQQESQLISENFIYNLLPNLLREISNPIFSIYISSNNEVETKYIIEHFINNNIDFAFPKISKNNIDLDYIVYQNNIELEKNNIFKTIKEPRSGKLATPDILIIPLVVFDKYKNRIGMAKGFFDRSIAKLKKENPNVYVIGVAYKLQYYPSTLPTEKHDQSLDCIVSSDFIIS